VISAGVRVSSGRRREPPLCCAVDDWMNKPTSNEKPQTGPGHTAPEPTGQNYRDRIAERAHELWERDGRPHGKDEHYWFLAERELGRHIDDRGARSEPL
jgi:hypothetical protein